MDDGINRGFLKFRWLFYKFDTGAGLTYVYATDTSFLFTIVVDD